MRRPEIGKGWELEDAAGNVVADGARSSVAASKGVYSTVFSRAVLQVPAVFMPTLITAIPAVSSLITAQPWINLPLTTFLCLCSFGVGLPVSLAVFPQRAEIDVTELEEPFQNLVDADGNPIKTLFYNKGL